MFKLKIKDFIKHDNFKRLLVVLFCLIWIGSICLKALYIQFSIGINKLPIISRINGNMGIALMFTVIVIVGFIIFISGKKFRTTLIITNIILSIIFLADLLYGRYYYNPITVPILRQITFLSAIKESTASLFKLRDLLLFIDLIILIGIAYYLRGFNNKRPFYIQMIIGFLIMLVGFTGVNFKYNQLDASRFAYERKYIGRDLGLIYYHYYDVKEATLKAMAKGKKLNEEDKKLIESVNVGNKIISNEYTGIGEGKNLIIIQLEAFQEFLIDLEVDGQEVTPFLNSLKNDSIYMPNYFIETAGGNTVDAELLTNTSMLPTATGSAYYQFPNNTYITLPNKLKEKGYAANSFHGYEASFWNREVMHKTLGFDRFYSLDDFDLTEKVGWAISDKEFFRQSLDKTLESSKGKPFYSFMVALSSHHPYDAFYSGPFTKKEGQSKEIFRRYINAGNYVDSALKDFFDYLKEKEVYEDTIVVIYGDHAGMFNEDAKATCEFFGVDYNAYEWQKFEKIPLYIYIPGINNGITVDKVCGQSDLLPTLSNIMGFELEYTMSQDILNEGYKGYALRRSSNVITNEYIFIAQEDRLYDFETGAILDIKNFQEEISGYYNEILAQDLIYRSDYLKEFYKE